WNLCAIRRQAGQGTYSRLRAIARPLWGGIAVLLVAITCEKVGTTFSGIAPEMTFPIRYETVGAAANAALTGMEADHEAQGIGSLERRSQNRQWHNFS